MDEPAGLLQRGPGALTVLVALLPLSLGGCFTPPLVRGPKDPPSELRELRAGVNARLSGAARAVSLTVDEGDAGTLLGLHLDAGDGRPLVLHLLPSGFTLRTSGVAVANVFRQFEQLGFGSLCFDYPGVGYSSGDARHLAEWSRVMLEGAAQLAGSSDLLLVRGTSLGSMVAAKGLEGLGPLLGATWIAPVRSRDVVRRFARESLGWPLGPIGASLFASPRLGDPVAAALHTPSFVVASAGDPLLDEAARQELLRLAQGWARELDAEAPEGAGGFLGPERSHVVTGSYFGRLAPGEVQHAVRLGQRVGLDLESELAAALARRTGSATEEVERWWARMGADAAELALLLLTRRPELADGGPGLLEPLRPDGTPVPLEAWLPFFRSVWQDFPLVKSLDARLEGLLFLALDDAPITFEMRIETGWPFDERVRFGERWTFADPVDRLAILAFTAGLPNVWRIRAGGTAVLAAGSTLTGTPGDPALADLEQLHPELSWSAFSSDPAAPRPELGALAELLGGPAAAIQSSPR